MRIMTYQLYHKFCKLDSMLILDIVIMKNYKGLETQCETLTNQYVKMQLINENYDNITNRNS